MAAVIASLVAAPIIALAVVAFRGSPDLWAHLAAYVLPASLRDTVVLLAGVGGLTALIGTSTAWLVSAHEFPGRRWFEWALLLPLAVPTYIIAYAYLDLLHPIGPVQTALRALLGFDSPRDFRLPDIRSMAGCIVLLSFVLYPYVYLAARAVFLMQSANLIEAARTLGVTSRGVFVRIALPLARPAVAVGVCLAMLEALNDIGAAEFLGVRTLTVSVYATWATRSDLPGAAQIALAMLGVVVSVVLLERWARRHRRYHNAAQHPRPLPRRRMSAPGAAVAASVCLVPVLVGFVFPGLYLADAAFERIQLAGLPPAIIDQLANTVTVAAIATVLCVVLALLVIYAVRSASPGPAAALGRIASLGYAVPGAVLATGMLPIVIGTDAFIDVTATHVLGISTGMLLLGSGAAIVYACTVRFLAVAAGSTEAGFSRIPLELDAAARTLGQSRAGVLRRIHLPLLRPAVVTGALLVFVDTLKELPATLLLRPLNFETLATWLYGEAVRGTYEDGAIAALLIVAAGLAPVLLLARMGTATTGLSTRNR